MNHNEHKRAKMGMLPGDISKRGKIALLEKTNKKDIEAGKSFKKILRNRERARLKERTRELAFE